MIKMLLIFIGLYFFFRFLTRFVLPFFIGKAVNKMQNKKNQGQPSPKKKQKPSKPKDGEYIDYEEVE